MKRKLTILYLIGLSLWISHGYGKSQAFQCFNLTRFCNANFNYRLVAQNRRADILELPIGLQFFRGVPFQITDELKNKTHDTIIALKGEFRQDLPMSVTLPAPPSRFSVRYLYFLQTCAWGGSPNNIPIGQYIIEYKSGRTYSVPLRVGRELSNWWGIKDTSKSVIAWFQKRGAAIIGVGLFVCKNPYPKDPIEAVVFQSFNRWPVPILAAITVAKHRFFLQPRAHIIYQTNTHNWLPLSKSKNKFFQLIDFKKIIGAPAGTHGFLKTKSDPLEFQDGTRARFWGTQLSSSCWLWNRSKDILRANQLLNLGYNLVWIDWGQLARQSNLNFHNVKKGNLFWNHLDQLIAQMNQDGIYVAIECNRKDHDFKNVILNHIDFLTRKTYFQNPGIIFPPRRVIHESWVANSKSLDNLTIIKNIPMVMHPKKSLIEKFVQKRIFGEPFWAKWSVGWNSYLAEVPYLLSAYASFENWDAVIAGSDFIHTQMNRINSQNIPILWCQEPMAALNFYEHNITSGKILVISRHLKASDSRLVLSSLAHESGLNFSRRYFTNPMDSTLAVVVPSLNSFITDSHQINWHGNIGVVEVDSPRFQSFIGFLANRTFKNSTWKVRTSNFFASVGMISLDGKPIINSDHLLISGVSRMENTKMQFNRSEDRILSNGRSPILNDALHAVFWIHHFDQNHRFYIQAFNEQGQPIHQWIYSKWIGNDFYFQWIPRAFYMEISEN